MIPGGGGYTMDCELPRIAISLYCAVAATPLLDEKTAVQRLHGSAVKSRMPRSVRLIPSTSSNDTRKNAGRIPERMPENGFFLIPSAGPTTVSHWNRLWSIPSDGRYQFAMASNAPMATCR